MTALEVRDLHKSFGGLRVATAVNLAVTPASAGLSSARMAPARQRCST